MQVNDRKLKVLIVAFSGKRRSSSAAKKRSKWNLKQLTGQTKDDPKRKIQRSQKQSINPVETQKEIFI